MKASEVCMQTLAEVGWKSRRVEIGCRRLIWVVGYGPLLRDYVYFLLAKLAFHRQHPEFNGMAWSGDAACPWSEILCRTFRI